MPSKLLNLGKKVWQEDDVNYEGKETIYQAWNRITGTQLAPLKVVDRLDFGDVFYTLEENGYIIENCYGLMTIYEPGLDIEQTKTMIKELEAQIEDLKNKYKN